jgi:hypothetical protein
MATPTLIEIEYWYVSNSSIFLCGTDSVMCDSVSDNVWTQGRCFLLFFYFPMPQMQSVSPSSKHIQTVHLTDFPLIIIHYHLYICLYLITSRFSFFSSPLLHSISSPFLFSVFPFPWSARAKNQKSKTQNHK